MTHTTREIELLNLIGNGRVRSTPAHQEAHDELVASIRAHGLLENLVVAPLEGDKEGTFEVVAGNRRLQALREIHKDAAPAYGGIRVWCTVLDQAVRGDEASLAENVVRVAMHPGDAAVAFHRLVEAGATTDDVATRFGLPESTVLRWLRLAHLAPEIMEAFRAGKLTNELASTYATTADHDRQMTVFRKFQDGFNHVPSMVARDIEGERTRSDSDMALFVGLKAYTEAGGASEQMLFEDCVMLDDSTLLHSLAEKKLEAAAARVAKGWKWVRWFIEDNERWNLRYKCDRVFPTTPKATDEEKAAIQAVEDFSQKHDFDDVAELSDELQAEYERLADAARKAADDRAKRSKFSAAKMKTAGVVLFIERGGKLGREEGLVLPEDRRRAQQGTSSTGGGGSKSDAKSKGYSSTVREAITELRGAALRDVLRTSPDLATDLLHFDLLLSIKTGWDPDDDVNASFYPTRPLSITREAPRRHAVPGDGDEVKAFLADGDWKAQLEWFDPRKSVGELFRTFRALPDADRAALVAEMVARLLHSTANQGPDCHSVIADTAELNYAERLLDVSPSIWSVDRFWSKLRRDQIIDECSPYLGKEWAKGAATMKKKELAADAAERMREHREWLPRGFQPGADA